MEMLDQSEVTLSSGDTSVRLTAPAGFERVVASSDSSAVLSASSLAVLLMRLLHTAVEIPVAAAASTGISLGFDVLFLCVIVALDRTKLRRSAGTKTMWASTLVASGFIGPLVAIYGPRVKGVLAWLSSCCSASGSLAQRRRFSLVRLPDWVSR